MNVATILKSKGRAVTTASPSQPLHEIAESLAARKIGAIVVVGETGRVVGIISERDIVRCVAEGGAAALARPVDQVMTRGVVTCGEATSLEELMELMTKGRFRHVPVVEHDTLVGLVSIGDVVKYHLADMALEVSSMRNYLATG